MAEVYRRVFLAMAALLLVRVFAISRASLAATASRGVAAPMHGLWASDEAALMPGIAAAAPACIFTPREHRREKALPAGR